MKKVFLVLALMLFLLALDTIALAQDAGVPDTLYVEVYPDDEYVCATPPRFLRFPIYVTHDIVDPSVDSIAGFIIPLCYTHVNVGDYCSLGSYWNNIGMISDAPDVDRSIFRHLPAMDIPVVRNRMMDLNSNGMNGWDFVFLELGDEVSQFFLSMVPTGSEDQLWWEGSRVLLATMTFKILDSDTFDLCIDSCLWPPSSRLAFSNCLAETYIPQHFLPVCQSFDYRHVEPPYFTTCPGQQVHDTEGTFTVPFVVFCQGGVIVSVGSHFSGSGVTGVNVTYFVYPPAAVVEGEVEYTVTDRCQSGGTITLTAWNDVGGAGECEIDIMIYNDPPHFSLPDTVLAIAGSIRRLLVSAADAENDPVSIGFDALWYEPDSLRPPTNTPSYDGGNPGIFSWLPVEGEDGPWICSFSATDSCGAVTTHRVTIPVGSLFCGDNNPDEVLDLGDLVYLLNYLFVGGPPPNPLCKGDANCDSIIDLGDLVHLLNYLFKYGSAPCFECCAGS